MLVAARDERCLAQVLVIAAALSVQDPRERPLEQAAAADERHARFADERSDFLAFLKLWKLLGRAELAAAMPRQFPLATRACANGATSHGAAAEARWTELDWPASSAQRRRSPRAIARSTARCSPACSATSACRTKAMTQLHRRARHQVLGASGLVDEEAGQVDRRRRAGRDDAALRAQRRRHRAEVAGGDRRAPAQARIAERPALGEDRARRWWRSSAARCTGCRCTPTGACTTGRSTRSSSREIFIRSALVEGDYDTRAPFFAHNRRLVARHRAPGAQVAPPRHPGGRRADPRVLRRSAFRREVPQRRADFERWRAQAERSRAAPALPLARGPDAPRGRGHHHRELPARARARRRTASRSSTTSSPARRATA